MNIYTVSLTRSILAKTEEGARIIFEEDVIKGGDWDADSLDVELEEQNEETT